MEQEFNHIFNSRIMKKFKLIFTLVVSIILLSTSCNKSNDNGNPDGNLKGSFNVNINGIGYDKLVTNVEEMNEGVTFFAEDGNGGTFQIAITDVPEVGTTVTLSLDAGDGETNVILIDGPIDGYTRLMGGAGTVKREDANTYNLNITLFGGDWFSDEFPMSGTIIVGS